MCSQDGRKIPQPCEQQKEYLVLTVVRSGSTQPDLVFSEVAGNVGHHLAHGNSLATAIITRQPGGPSWL